jgi:hypothetical protein
MLAAPTGALRRPYYRTERAFLNLANTSVQETAGGDLLISGLTSDTVRYTPQDGGTYRELDGPNHIAFRREQGRLLLLDPTGAEPLERIGFFPASRQPRTPGPPSLCLTLWPR